MSASDCSPEEKANAGFTTTHWSVVLAARDQNSTTATEALDQLCGTYWYPLYFYVRRLGHSAEDARDLTQEFFARVLEKRLKPFLIGEAERGLYAETAARLELSVGALQVAVHRLRQRYRELLRGEIAHTVARTEDIDDEIRSLFAAMT